LAPFQSGDHLVQAREDRVACRTSGDFGKSLPAQLQDAQGVSDGLRQFVHLVGAGARIESGDLLRRYPFLLDYRVPIVGRHNTLELREIVSLTTGKRVGELRMSSYSAMLMLILSGRSRDGLTPATEVDVLLVTHGWWPWL
jgi:hypothetical protein